MLVVAHRGLVGPDHPENTLPAVEAALVAGADAVEVDVRLTADGVLALSHDADLRRLTGVPLPVVSSPWADLASAAARCGLPLCRLEEVLDLAAGRRLVLEMKGPPPGSGAVQRTAAALARALGARGSGQGAEVTVSSFTAPLLRQVRLLLGPASGVRTALLGQPWETATSVVTRALADGHDEVHPWVDTVLGTTDVETAHDAGLTVVPWTVNATRDVQRLQRAGADGVITDVPRAVQAALVPAYA